MNKKVKKYCEKIFGFFACLNDEGDYGKEFRLGVFIDWFPKLESLNVNGELNGKMDKLMDLFWDIRAVAFGMGYVIGHEFDITYPEAKRDIKAVKKFIREKQLLPYLPREKKAA